jgi:hypothetical protein
MVSVTARIAGHRMESKLLWVFCLIVLLFHSQSWRVLFQFPARRTCHMYTGHFFPHLSTATLNMPSRNKRVDRILNFDSLLSFFSFSMMPKRPVPSRITIKSQTKYPVSARTYLPSSWVGLKAWALNSFSKRDDSHPVVTLIENCLFGR